MSGHIEPVAPGDRLRIAVLGDFDGVHTRSWLRWFIERGHDIHAISYYPPAAAIDGASLHVLRPGRAHGAVSKRRPQPRRGGARVEDRLPRGIVRVAHALRHRRAGLARVVRGIAPDVLHGHFVVEHGFYGTMAAFHPYVVTAWGSDILVEPGRDPVSKMIARWTLRRADLLTSNNAYMSQRMIALGASKPKVELITLGADRFDLDAYESSVNVRDDASSPPTIISTRAHEPLYNIGGIIDAYGRVARTHSDARLVIAHSGSQTVELQRRAATAGGRIEFAGPLDRAAFRYALAQAHIFVSVPSSDGTSVALLQAMAAGCFPIVSDLATQREWIEDGVNGFRVPLRRPDLLAAQIARALDDAPLRHTAARRNRELVETRGLNEHEMPKMEALYRRLAERSSPR